LSGSADDGVAVEVADVVDVAFAAALIGSPAGSVMVAITPPAGPATRPSEARPW
jgi:hypothetical protein